jgi:hypothetical protein
MDWPPVWDCTMWWERRSHRRRTQQGRWGASSAQQCSSVVAAYGPYAQQACHAGNRFFTCLSVKGLLAKSHTQIPTSFFRTILESFSVESKAGFKHTTPPLAGQDRRGFSHRVFSMTRSMPQTLPQEKGNDAGRMSARACKSGDIKKYNKLPPHHSIHNNYPESRTQNGHFLAPLKPS